MRRGKLEKSTLRVEQTFTGRLLAVASQNAGT
jgi:hypothetical protein